MLGVNSAGRPGQLAPKRTQVPKTACDRYGRLSCVMVMIGPGTQHQRKDTTGTLRSPGLRRSCLSSPSSASVMHAHVSQAKYLYSCLSLARPHWQGSGL